MRMILCILSLSLAAAFAEARTDRAPGSADQSELLRLEKLWNEAHLNGDADTLDSLWAEELVVTVPNMPLMTKPQTLRIWRTGRMKFQRYETSDIGVRVFGDAAVVTGRVLRARNVNGQDVQEDWRFTKVYVRRAGKWQIVAWHASPAAQQ